MTRTSRMAAIAALVASLALAACSAGGGGAASPTLSAPSTAPTAAPAMQTAEAASPSSGAGQGVTASASANSGTAAGANDRCSAFQSEQVSPLTGGDPFQTAEPAMLDVPGCQWYFDSGVGNINLQILPGAQYTDWSGKPGVTPVSGVGDSAFVGPYVLGGTMAGAQVGGAFYFLTVSPAPSNDAVVAFLKQAIAQAGGS